jgi:hypothetical protein
VTEAGPVFVAGLDHSGKTSLRTALADRTGIRLVRHIELWTRLWPALARGRGPIDRLVADELTRGAAEPLGLDGERLARALTGGFGDLVRELGRQLCERSGAPRWGLQEALLELVATHVLREVPEARIVHLVRDPRDRYDVMLRAGAVGRGGVGAETAAWIASTRAAMRAAAAHPESIRIVRYESWLEDRETTLRKVCAFLGEPSRPGAASGPAEPRRHAAAAAGTGLAERDVAFIQARTGAELLAMGYPLLPVAARAGMLRHRMIDAVRWQAGRLAWRRRTRHLSAPFAAQGG